MSQLRQNAADALADVVLASSAGENRLSEQLLSGELDVESVDLDEEGSR